jgi:hypothetical protein
MILEVRLVSSRSRLQNYLRLFNRLNLSELKSIDSTSCLMMREETVLHLLRDSTRLRVLLSNQVTFRSQLTNSGSNSLIRIIR